LITSIKMSYVVFADETASIEDVDFSWHKGYWHQETGSNITEFGGDAGALLCDELNRPRKEKKLLIGYGIKNLYGKLIYEIAPVVEQEFSHDEYERLSGDGYYPFVKRDPMYPSYVNHLFVLDNDGYWVQLSGYYILGIDGKEGKEEALTALNAGPNKGIGIKNAGGKVLC
jgi:hypothetical protein